MLSNRLAFAALTVACLAAAAGGGYLATRQNTVPAPASAQGQSAAPASRAEPKAAPGVKASNNPPASAVKAPVSGEPVPAGTARKAPPTAKTGNADQNDRSARASAAPREDRQAVSPGKRPEPAPLAVSNNAITQVPLPAAPIVDNAAAAPHPDDHAAQEPVRPADPPQHTFSELVVSAESVIGLQTETRVSSETARVEDRVEARVTRDVRVSDRVAIPAGTRAIGAVMQVERGGKFKERARLGIRFHTLVLADGTRIPISTETIFREGEAPGNSSPSKVGGAAVGGAILGAILGGGKGAAIGAAAGAGAGTAVVAAGDRNAAILAAGTSMTVRINQPVTITTENKE